MLSKLIKYDLKAVSPVLLTIHGAVLILSLLGHFFMSLLHIKPFDTIFSSIYTVTLLTAIGAVALATIVYLGMRYHRNLYTDEGYLTNTLPVTANCHVLSKYLCGVLWSFLDAAVILLCVFIFLNDELFEFCQAVSAYIPANLFLLTIATVILELFYLLSVRLLRRGHWKSFSRPPGHGMYWRLRSALPDQPGDRADTGVSFFYQ